MCDLRSYRGPAYADDLGSMHLDGAMGTHNARTVRCLLLLPLVMLSACVAGPARRAGGSPSMPPSTSAPIVASPASPTNDLSDSTWNPRTASLGATVTTDSGLSVRVSAPAHVRDISHASGTQPHQINVVFAVMVDNGQSAPFDLRLLTLSAAFGPSATACAEVHDDAAGMGVRRTMPLPPGGTTAWRARFSCPGAPGQPLVVAFTPGPGFADLEFTGQLP